MIEMLPLLEAIKTCLKHHQAVRLVLLFGSRARGKERENSDVDLAVWAPGVDLLALAAELTLAAGKEVQVVSLEDPGIPLMDEILKHGQVVHEGFVGVASSWRSRALCQMELDRPWYAKQRKAWLQRVASEGL